MLADFPRPKARRLGRRALTLHGGLQGVDGVDFRDDDAGAEGPQRLDAAFADVAVARYHGDLPGDHDVGGSLDAVDQTLPAAVQVVELTLQRRADDEEEEEDC